MNIHKIDKIINNVKEMLYGERKTMLKEIERRERDPFQVLIATILSHRTKDEVTRKASKRLFSRFKDAKELSKADEKEVEELIKPVGFYKQKAKKVILVAKIINDKYDGKVPDSLDELLKLPSVGRKTANCVLVYGFNLPAIPVDTHVHRIANRLGIVNTKKPEETEVKLEEVVDKKHWIEINNLFVKFGKIICKPIAPLCNKCKLKDICKYYKEKVSP